jgi:phosphatidate cytidylyltransferase
LAPAQPDATSKAAARPVGAKPSRWRDLAPRVASAMALGPIVLGAVWFGGLAWQGLLTLFATVAMVEWAGLCGLKLDGWLSVAAAASVPAAQAAYLATGLDWAPAVVLLAVAAALNGWHRLLAGGVLYVGAGYCALLLLRHGSSSAGMANLLFVLLVVWANDIGAYAAGRLIGGRRMAPRLSPGKTWAGAGGGLVFSLAAGLAVAAWFGADYPGQYRAEGLAAGLSVCAQAGDLLESALKRRSGRKDSGHLLPGHGGLLDRVDGLLPAVAAALLWQLAWRGVLLWQ